ncbi:dTMP kinase [uncultured Campylobacter sp.]|uniref:dTMP kinase n=1 Tax=uncultured Campylobacter sp. TaxID=218934 RepID=UPI0026158619|nr:dTMP kinase [uncultured Campylobacter sp.]
MYVAIEGIDCVGKSTQIEILKKDFKEALFTFEPGATELGKNIRNILLDGKFALSKKTEFLLFLADRAQHYYEVISKNKEKLIISDRSLISGIAYAKDYDIELLFKLNSFAIDDFLPQKIIFLYIDEEELSKRLENKAKDNIEKRGISYFLEIQNNIKNTINFLKEKEKKLKILNINAALKKEEIYKKIKEFLND